MKVVFLVVIAVVIVAVIYWFRAKISVAARRAEDEARSFKGSAEAALEHDYQKAKAAGAGVYNRARDKL